MGYALAIGPCLLCKQPFTFNPMRVPSFRVNGVKEPICQHCMELANVKRKEMGMEPFPIDPEAYEAADEQELE